VNQYSAMMPQQLHVNTKAQDYIVNFVKITHISLAEHHYTQALVYLFSQAFHYLPSDSCYVQNSISASKNSSSISYFPSTSLSRTINTVFSYNTSSCQTAWPKFDSMISSLLSSLPYFIHNSFPGACTDPIHSYQNAAVALLQISTDG
jgi:hypothetical protein